MKTFFVKLWIGVKAFFVSLVAWLLSLIVQQNFWALGLALVVFLLKTKYPQFEIDVALAASVLVMLSIYLVSLIKDPGPDTWKKIFSRKLWCYIASLAALVLNGFGVTALLGIPVESIYAFLGAMGITIITVAYDQPSVG